MASCIWQSISLIFFWTTFFIWINQDDCMTLRQSGLAVFPVDSCPGNLSEVQAATLRLNCSDVKGFRNVYHCLPLSNISLLVEFCYDGFSGLIEEGNCMVLENHNLNNHPCNHFINGCPGVPYFPKNMFSFPACIQINKENRCYLADRSCPNISFIEETTMPTLNTIGNNTVPTNDLNPVVLGALVAFFLIGLVILIVWIWKRHRSLRRKGNEGTPIGCEETSHLMAKEDNEANKSMTSTTQKHESFVSGSMAMKPVTAIPGIGPVLGRRLAEQGFNTATQIYGIYLNKNEPDFKSWFHDNSGGNAGHQTACYGGLQGWFNNYQ